MHIVANKSKAFNGESLLPFPVRAVLSAVIPGRRKARAVLRHRRQRVSRKSPWHERAVLGENRSAGPAPCANPYRAQNVYSLFLVHMRAPRKAVVRRRHHVETPDRQPGRRQTRSAHTKDR